MNTKLIKTFVSTFKKLAKPKMTSERFSCLTV